jgi:hypothetical protein
MRRSVIDRRKTTSRAMNPGWCGASRSVTTVHGRPSAGLVLSSNPCASSAMTPM